LVIQAAMVLVSPILDSYLAGFIVFLLLGFFFNLCHNFVGWSFYYMDVKKYTLLGMDLTSLNVDLVCAFLIGLPLAVSFITAFKNLDLKPRKYVIKPYLIVALPVIAVEFMVLIFTYNFYS